LNNCEVTEMQDETMRILLFILGIFFAAGLLLPFYMVLDGDKIEAAFKRMAKRFRRNSRAA